MAATATAAPGGNHPVVREWREKVEVKQRAGLTRSQAMRAVDREFPGLRQKMLAAYNGRPVEAD